MLKIDAINILIMCNSIDTYLMLLYVYRLKLLM